MPMTLNSLLNFGANTGLYTAPKPATYINGNLGSQLFGNNSNPYNVSYTAPQKLGASTSIYGPQQVAVPVATPNVNQQQTIGAPVDQQINNLRNEISSGWDNYINSLNDQISGLDQQRVAQEGIVNSQFDQGLGTLDLQKTQGLQQLGNQRTQADTNQKKTLKDLSANMRNMFDAGNVMLGARGAGDSSAANQYAYALTKMGTQQRTNVMNNTANIMNEIGGRETNLQNIYNNEVKNLTSARDQGLLKVSSWFAEAQNQLKMAMSQGVLGKGQDISSLSKNILNAALAELSRINQTYSQNKLMIDQWVMSNSKPSQQTINSFNQQAAYNPALPQAARINGQPYVDQSSGNFYLPGGFGGGYGSQLDEYGRPIS